VSAPELAPEVGDEVAARFRDLLEEAGADAQARYLGVKNLKDASVFITFRGAIRHAIDLRAALESEHEWKHPIAGAWAHECKVCALLVRSDLTSVEEFDKAMGAAS
jgi:hypothetical protein